MEDFVQDACECALKRKEEWTTGDAPDVDRLFGIAMGRITHRVADLAALEENKNVPLEGLLEKNPDAWEMSTEESTSQYGTVPGELLAVEQMYFQQQIKSRALQRLSADDTETAFFGLTLEGVTKPQEISEETGLTTRQVDNVRKRVLRKLGPEFADLKPLYRRRSPGPGRKPDEE